MKKIFLSILLLLFSSTLFGQIVVYPFNSEEGNGTKQIAKKIESQLKEDLSKSFSLPSRDFSIAQDELKVQDIRNYFKKTIEVNFTPASYAIKGYISQSKNFTTLFDIRIDIINLQTNDVSTLTQNYLSESNNELISEYIAQYIKNIVPTIYKINSFIDKETISINYGADRSAIKNDVLELISTVKDEVLGEVTVNKVFSTSSNCEFKLVNDQVDFNEMTYRNYYLRTKRNNDKAEKFRIKLAELRSERAEKVIRDKEELELENETDKYRSNDWLIFTVQNFTFNSDTLKKFFNTRTLTPLVFGLQINFAKANTRFFINGRLSLTSEVNENIYLTSNQTIHSKLFFFQLGCGIQQKFSILNFMYPGIIFGINYMYTSIEFQDNNLNNIVNQAYRGIDVDFLGSLTFKLGSFGIYGEGGYHFVPLLKNDDNIDLKTTGFSVGAGISFFF